MIDFANFLTFGKPETDNLEQYSEEQLYCRYHLVTEIHDFIVVHRNLWGWLGFMLFGGGYVLSALLHKGKLSPDGLLTYLTWGCVSVGLFLLAVAVPIHLMFLWMNRRKTLLEQEMDQRRQ